MLKQVYRKNNKRWIKLPKVPTKYVEKGIYITTKKGDVMYCAKNIGQQDYPLPKGLQVRSIAEIKEV